MIGRVARLLSFLALSAALPLHPHTNGIETERVALDPNLAMAYWGIALALAESARSVPKTLDFGINRAAALMAIAVPYLDGPLALLAGNTAGAIGNL